MTIEYTDTQTVEVCIVFTVMKMTHFTPKRSTYVRIVVISAFEVYLF